MAKSIVENSFNLDNISKFILFSSSIVSTCNNSSISDLVCSFAPFAARLKA
jgi:hypothetical protein